MMNANATTIEAPDPGASGVRRIAPERIRNAHDNPAAELERLRYVADRLRLMASCPPDVLPHGRWLEIVDHELNEFANVLFRHFAHEEDGGYFAELLLECPSFESRVRSLAREHDVVTDDVEQILNAVCSAAPRPLIEARIVGLLNRIEAHEEAENEIVQEALLVDLGG